MPESASNRTNRVELHVEQRGTGEPVLFISGSGADLRVKPNVLNGPLPKAFRTIAYDQRGLGQTEKPAGPYSMADYADDAAQVLDDLDVERAHVIGVSFGGMVALHFALLYPERINKLVLCCTSPGGSLPSYPFHELPDNLSPGERVTRLMHVSDTRRHEAWQASHPELVQKIVDMTEQAAIADHQTAAFRRGSKLQLQARAEHDVINQLPDIPHETLICAGKYDGIAPEASQEALLAGIPASRLLWFEGGHLFMIQDKQAWPAILQFLQ